MQVTQWETNTHLFRGTSKSVILEFPLISSTPALFLSKPSKLHDLLPTYRLSNELPTFLPSSKTDWAKSGHMFWLNVANIPSIIVFLNIIFNCKMMHMCSHMDFDSSPTPTISPISETLKSGSPSAGLRLPTMAGATRWKSKFQRHYRTNTSVLPWVHQWITHKKKHNPPVVIVIELCIYIYYIYIWS